MMKLRLCWFGPHDGRAKINFVGPGEPVEPLISMVLIAEANPKTIQARFQARAMVPAKAVLPVGV
jgi:hypothetical protein